MKTFTAEEAARIDLLIAIHLFGYRWFRYPLQSADLGYLRVEPYTALEVPATYQVRYGAIMAAQPEPGDELDIDIPAYHKDEDYTVAISEKCLEDGERSLILHKCLDSGYCYGDIQGEHYSTIPMALAAYAVKHFKLEQKQSGLNSAA